MSATLIKHQCAWCSVKDLCLIHGQALPPIWSCVVKISCNSVAWRLFDFSKSACKHFTLNISEAPIHNNLCSISHTQIFEAYHVKEL